MRLSKENLKSSLSLKRLALFTLISFTSTQAIVPAPTGFAQNSNPPGGPVSTAQVSATNRWTDPSSGGLNSTITVPPELGKIEESFQGNTQKTILFIQDAHDSLEAQENIAKLISRFVKEHGIKTVFEEGYEGAVPTDRFFGFIKDPKIKQKVSYFLLDKLRLGGAEYAHVNRAQDFDLIGVDSLKLYAENIKVYRDASKTRAETEADLNELFNHISILANRHFPKELKSWLRSKERSSKGKLPLLDYLKTLHALHLKTKPNSSQFSQEYPALSILLVAETTKDKKLITQLNALDSKFIFEEMTRLEKNISDAFLRNGQDKKIFDYYQGLSLLKRLNQIQLTQSEYDVAKETLQNFKTHELADFIVSLTHKSLVLSKEWERHIKDAVQFYKVAQTRDQSINEHLKKFIKSGKEDGAVLVFGGFHATAIKELLREQGLSYAVVSPIIAQIDKKHQDYYRELMSVGHYPFEVPFWVPRANKPPSSFYLAAIGQEAFVRSELRALVSAVKNLGDSFDSQLIEKRLAVVLDNNAAGIRSEMRGSEVSDVSRADGSRQFLERKKQLKTDIVNLLKKQDLGNDSADIDRLLEMVEEFGKVDAFLKGDGISTAIEKTLKDFDSKVSELQTRLGTSAVSIREIISEIQNALPPAHFEWFVNERLHGFHHSLRLLQRLLDLFERYPGLKKKLDTNAVVIAIFMHDLENYVSGTKHNLCSRFLSGKILKSSGFFRNLYPDGDPVKLNEILDIIEAHNHRDLRDQSVYERFYAAQILKDIDALDSASNPEKIADIGLNFKQPLLGKWEIRDGRQVLSEKQWDLQERLKVLILDNVQWNRQNEQNYDNFMHILFAVVIERLPGFYKSEEVRDFVSKAYGYETKTAFKNNAAKTLDALIVYALAKEKRILRDEDEEMKELNKLRDGVVGFVSYAMFDSPNKKEIRKRDWLCGPRIDLSEEGERVKTLTAMIADYDAQISRSEMRMPDLSIDSPESLVSTLKRLYANIEKIDQQELEEILAALKTYLARLKDEMQTKNIPLEKHLTIDEVISGIRADAGKPCKKTKFVKKIKGELSDIVNEEDLSVGVTEAGISHMFGLGHRTANGFVFTPTGKVLLQRRVHNKAEPKRLSIFGGHVVAGQSYADSMRREILEELGLDAIEEELENQLNLIGSDGQFSNGDPNNPEFRSLYSYVLTETEYAYLLQKMRELDDKKSDVTIPEFEAWIENEQRNKSGYGEVWGYQIADFQDLTSGQSITLEEQFKDGQRVRENVEYSSDLLLPLVAGNAPLSPGATSIHPMEEVKSSVERTLLGTPYYGIYLQQSNISKALRDPRYYYDVTAVVVKKDAAPYMVEELQDAKGREIPLNSEIQIVDFSEGRPAEISVKNGVPVILVCIVSEDSEGVISSIVETLEGLKTSGVNVGEKNVSMILTAGLGSRNYPMTAVTGNGNKGLLKSINGESNARVALQQSMQFYRPDGRGVHIFEVDKIMAISQPISRYQEKDIQLIGSTVPIAYEFLSLHPKVDVDANGNVRRIVREKTDEERVLLDGKTEVAMYDNTGLYLSGKAANALVSKYVNAQGRVTDKKLSLHRGFLLRHQEEFSSLSMGFIDTGRQSMSVHIGDNPGYRKAIRQLFYDAALRGRMGVVIDWHTGAVIGREVVLGKGVRVAPGAVILGRTVIEEGEIPGGALIIDAKVRKIDMEPDSWLIGVEEEGMEPVTTKRGEIVSDVRINQEGRSVKKRIVVKMTDDPKAMFAKPLSGIPWSWDQIRKNLDLTGAWRFLKRVADISFGVRTSDRSSLPYPVFYDRYGFKKVYFEKILFGGGSSKIDESPFLINADGRQYVLRYLKDRAAVEYIVAYQMKLKERGIPVPYIRRMLDGSLYFSYGDKIYYLEEMLDQGQEVDVADLTPHHYAGMGRMAARMHNAVEGKTNPTGINAVRSRQVIGAYEAEYDKRYLEIAAKRGLHTKAEQLFLESYPFFKVQFVKFKQGYADYLQSGISDIAIHGDLAYTNLRFDANGEVVGIFDLSRAHNTKAIVDLIQVIFGRKNVGPIHFNQEIFRAALGAYQKEVERKLGTKDVRALLEVLRSRFLEDIRNSLVNKEHRYYVDPSSDAYERRVQDVKEVIAGFKDFSAYAKNLGVQLDDVEREIVRGGHEETLITDKIFGEHHRSEMRSLLQNVAAYQNLNKHNKSLVLKKLSDLIYHDPDSDFTVLCMETIARTKGIAWEGVIARTGSPQITASVAVLREVMMDPLTTHPKMRERLKEGYKIDISDAEHREINRFIRTSDILQDMILYKSRRPRTVGIMRSLINEPKKVSDILAGKFCPLTGEIHPGISCGRFRCRFCYNSVTNSDGSMKKPIDYNGKENALNWNEIKRLVDDYIASGVKEIYVSGGKEPWYSGTFKDSDKKRTADLIHYIRQKSSSIIISMLTIGLELYDNPTVRKTAVNDMNIIRVSLDAATPEGYDQIKGLSHLVKGGKKTSGTFEMVREGIRQTLALRNKTQGTKLKIGMSFTCTENNYQELEQFLKMAQEWGVDFVDVKGVLANPQAAEKIRAFMAYISSMYDRALMGDFGNLNVYFHEDFFKKVGMKYDFDQELKVSDWNKPEKCYLALSGIRTLVVIPNGRAFTCINSGQPGYDSRQGDVWHLFRLGNYKGGVTVRALVELHQKLAKDINCRNCKHGTSTDENINSIMWKLEQDSTAGFSVEDQPIAPESDQEYYDGRAMYHKELSDARKRSEARESTLLSATSIPFEISRVSDSAMNVDAYVKTKLPAKMLTGLKNARLQGLDIHLGTKNDTQKILKKFQEKGANVSELPFQPPFSPTGETYYQVTQKNGAVSFVISAVRGRLFRFLAILKYLNVDMNKVWVRDFKTDWIAVYKEEISPNINGEISKVVICQNSALLAEQIKAEVPASDYQTFQSEHMQYATVRIEGKQLILINLSDAYSSQIAKVLEYVTLSKSSGGLGAKDILFIGESGGIGSDIKEGDFILPSKIYEDGQMVGEIENTDFRRYAAHFKKTKSNISVGPVETISTILSEDKESLVRQAEKGMRGVEMELAHAVRLLQKSSGIKFNAILKVTDLPGQMRHRLGDSAISAENRDDIFASMIGAMFHGRSEIRNTPAAEKGKVQPPDVIQKDFQDMLSQRTGLKVDLNDEHSTRAAWDFLTKNQAILLEVIKSSLQTIQRSPTYSGNIINVDRIMAEVEQAPAIALKKKEWIWIVDENDVPVGITNRTLAESNRLIHRTANAIVVTPEGKLLMQRRGEQGKSFYRALSIVGGHTGVELDYVLGARKEVGEEFHLEGQFKGQLILVSHEFYDEPGDSNREWRKLYLYLLTPEEYEAAKNFSHELDVKKKHMSKTEFQDWLKKQSDAKSGYGEVWGYYELDVNDVFSAHLIRPSNEEMPEYTKSHFDEKYPEGIHFVPIRDEFKDQTETSNAFFTADLLEEIVRSNKLPAEIQRSLGILKRVNSLVAGGEWNELRNYCRAVGKDHSSIKPWLFEVVGNAIRAKVKNAPSTFSINTKEREALRARIINESYGSGATKKERKLWLLLGLPGSGKSTALEKIRQSKGAMLIDSDEYKKKLPEYENGIYSERVHEESAKGIERKVREKAIAAGDNVAMQRIGRAHKVVEEVEEFRNRGYEVHVVFLDLPTEKAVDRAMMQFFEGDGRFCDTQFIRSAAEEHKSLLTYKLLKFLKLAADYEMWSADVPWGMSSGILERLESGQLQPTKDDANEIYDLMVDARRKLEGRGQHAEAGKIQQGVLKALEKNQSNRSEIRKGQNTLGHFVMKEESMIPVTSIGNDFMLKSRSVVRWVQQTNKPATVFVNAEDFESLSVMQKQEYFFVVLANKAIRIVVYNEHGQVRGKDLAALLKLDRVSRTDEDLEQTVRHFANPNVPAIQLSKDVLPSAAEIRGLRRKVAFFKTTGNKSGTLATALLWAISGGKNIQFQGVREENGFWTVDETLLDAIQRTFESNFVIAVAA